MLRSKKIESIVEELEKEYKEIKLNVTYELMQSSKKEADVLFTVTAPYITIKIQSYVGFSREFIYATVEEALYVALEEKTDSIMESTSKQIKDTLGFLLFGEGDK